MPKDAKLITFQLEINAVAARSETVNNVEYLVIPCVAVKEMVLNGILLPASEIARTGENGTWNGLPVPVSHPRDADGWAVSARSKDQMLASAGLFFDASVDTADEHKLSGNIWVDLERAYARGTDVERALSQLRNGHSAEVSTAFYSEVEFLSGTFAGVEYFGVFRDILPDHVAILLDEIGACSQEDGCGCPRANSMDADSYLQMTTDHAARNASASTSKRARESAQSMTAKLLRLQFKQKTETKTKENNMNRESMIAALIACDCCGLDRSALDAMTDEAIEAMHAMSASFGEKRAELQEQLSANADGNDDNSDADSDDAGNDDTDNDTDTGDSAPAVNKALQVLESVMADFGGVEQFTSTLQFLKSQNDDERAGLVRAIVANSTLTEPMLKNMDIAALRELGASLAPASYGGRVIRQNQDASDQETVLAMPSIDDNK